MTFTDFMLYLSSAIWIFMTIYSVLLFLSGVLSSARYGSDILTRKYYEYEVQAKLEGRVDWVKDWRPMRQTLQDQLHEAVTNFRSPNIIEIILERGVDGTAAFRAIAEQQTEDVTRKIVHANPLEMIEEGIDDTMITECYKKQLKSFLKFDYNINSKDSLGRTLLHSAVLNDNVYLVKTLFHFGAEINIEDNAGCTPTDYSRSSEIEDYLIEESIKFRELKFSMCGENYAWNIQLKEDQEKQKNSRRKCIDELEKMKRLEISMMKWFWLHFFMPRSFFERIAMAESSVEGKHFTMHDILLGKLDHKILSTLPGHFNIGSGTLNSLFPVYRNYLRLKIENITKRQRVKTEDLLYSLGLPWVCSRQIANYITERGDLESLEEAVLIQDNNCPKIWSRYVRIFFKSSLYTWNKLCTPIHKLYVRYDVLCVTFIFAFYLFTIFLSVEEFKQTRLERYFHLHQKSS